MMVVVTYDVCLTQGNGARRLRQVVRACKEFGQRVQYSVFEIEADPAQWVALKDGWRKLLIKAATACAIISWAPTGSAA